MKRTFQFHSNVTLRAAGVAEKPSTAWLKEKGAMSEITDTPTDTPVAIDSVDAYCARTGVVSTYLKADIRGS
jgi:hypothetical protein